MKHHHLGIGATRQEILCHPDHLNGNKYKENGKTMIVTHSIDDVVERVQRVLIVGIYL
jgi:uncharacterized protein YlzI (FlbEa/FlbD family)